MDRPTKEQIRELWEWCGLKYNATKLGYLSYWADASGEQIEEELILDLNNLFKYAVPKLQDKGCCVTIQSYECSGYLAFISESVFSQRGSDGYNPFYKRISECENESPVLALFWAIYEVIKDAKSS